MTRTFDASADITSSSTSISACRLSPLVSTRSASFIFKPATASNVSLRPVGGATLRDQSLGLPTSAALKQQDASEGGPAAKCCRAYHSAMAAHAPPMAA